MAHIIPHIQLVYLIEWSQRAEEVVVEEFTEPVGPAVYIPSDPLGCFNLLFDDDLVDTIVRETNRYAEQVLASQGSSNATIADQITRDCFEEITRYLHFRNNETLPQRGQPGYSRLQKVEPVMTAMKTKCASVYNPPCQLSVDEAMIPFKGRSAIKQYMPKKPTK